MVAVYVVCTGFHGISILTEQHVCGTVVISDFYNISASATYFGIRVTYVMV